jgi:hypothetical protein
MPWRLCPRSNKPSAAFCLHHARPGSAWQILRWPWRSGREDTITKRKGDQAADAKLCGKSGARGCRQALHHRDQLGKQVLPRCYPRPVASSRAGRCDAGGAPGPGRHAEDALRPRQRVLGAEHGNDQNRRNQRDKAPCGSQSRDPAWAPCHKWQQAGRAPRLQAV